MQNLIISVVTIVLSFLCYRWKRVSYDVMNVSIVKKALKYERIKLQLQGILAQETSKHGIENQALIDGIMQRIEIL